ncbi:MAG: NtaA/DmoA family FMN-dependent monooxygenase [Micrococcaceae bacterium]
MNSTTRRQMVLTMFMLPFGYQNDAWRAPSSRAEDVGSLDFITEMTTAAEDAKLHAVFFADSNEGGPLLSGDNRGVTIYEPVSTLGALAARTQHIGLIGTASTTFSDPFSIARQFASLDNLSQGRIGWNVVTSFTGFRNFGLEEMPDPQFRYHRATEFVEVVNALWRSWKPGAVIADRARGLWVDPQKVSPINHNGEHFRVQGPLNVLRPVQGRPLIVQAGQSPAGIELGTSVADAVYTMQSDQAKSIEFYREYKRKVAGKGRDPEQVKVLPGIMPIIGRTEQEARELSDDLASYIRVDSGRRTVAAMLDVDINDLNLNEKIPRERMVDGPSRMDRWRVYRDIALECTLGELITELSRAMGHRWIVGSAGRVAEDLIDWFDSRACDGFNLNPPSVPEGMRSMLTLLVPALQERGYFQADYSRPTLRESMGVSHR